MASQDETKGSAAGSGAGDENAGEFTNVISLFADKRGGPGNFDGSGFQIMTMVRLTLGWLREPWMNPLAGGSVACEPRHLVAEGQLGFDIGLRDAGVPDDLIEVKLSASAQHVTEVVAAARTMFEESGGADAGAAVRLVAERRTQALTSLERLVQHAGEATNDDSFQALVEASLDAQELALFAELGDHPFETVKLVGAPTLCGWEQTVQQVTWLSKALSSSAQASGLVDRLFRAFHGGATRRLSLSLRDLTDELRAAGLVTDPPAVDVSEIPGDVLAALMVLSECPLPLPAFVLAEALAMSEESLADLLVDHVRSGLVHEEGAYFWSPSRQQPFDTELGSEALSATLRILSREARQRGESFSAQTPNALALAKAVVSVDPDIVARCFVAFDKTAKAWGDLSATYDLARLSDQALLGLLDGDLEDRDRKTYYALRAQTFICGQGWVLQRVDALEAAAEFMRRAKEITDEFNDDENRAFALKCEGRLLRMQAEALNVNDPAREDLLHRSAELLTEAKPAFELVMRTATRSFVEDRGECVSLLARTVATQQDNDRAAELVVSAKELLATVQESKAMADLIILEAEIDARVRGGADPAGVLSTHVVPLTKIIDHFAEAGNHSRSEIAARARIVLGSFSLRAGDSEAAHVYFTEAVEQYNRLGCDVRRDDARLMDLLAVGGDLPSELTAALDAVGAPAGARIRAAEKFSRHYPAAVGVPDVEKSASPTLEPDVVESIVSTAMAEHTASFAPWGERPATA